MPLTAGETFGVNAGTSAFSAGFGILGTYLSNKWARENADHDRSENYKYNEMSADAADARTRDLYADLYSPQAQLQQLREAGLSPSVFYANGAGGISGQTGAQGDGASGVRQDTFGISNITPLDLSQIELNKSIARKNNADANITEQTTEEQIKSWFLDNENRSLRNEYMEWENAIKSINLNLLSTYGEEEITSKIKNIQALTNKVIQETRSATANAEVDEKTVNERINYITKQNLKLISDIALNRSQEALNKANINLSKAQITSLLEHIAIDWKNLNAKNSEIELGNKELEARITQWCNENGLTKIGYSIEILKMLANLRSDEKKFLSETLDAIIPF